MKKIVIVGAVAGGATVASQIRYYDKEAQIVVFDQDDTMSYGACGMPYVIGGKISDPEHLIAATPDEFKTERNIDVFLKHRVTKINRQLKSVEVLNLETQQSFNESYDFLILSPGGTPIVPETPGMESATMFTLRNFNDMKKINHYLATEKPKSCVIVGAGFIGVEMAENLVEIGLNVSIVEKSPQVMNILDVDCSALVEKELSDHGVRIFKDNFITNVNDSKISLDSGETLEADFILMSIGVSPSTKLAKDAGLIIGDTGGIITNEFLQTNDSSIYTIGDAAENKDFITGDAKRVPLAWPAHRQAFIVAKHITGEQIPFKGLLGTAICKVFSLDVALTGLNEKTLKDSSFEFKTITQKSKSNAGYYPDHAKVYLKVHYDSLSRKVLGAQAVGGKGIDKRIDVLSTAIYAGLTVDDLQALELAYAPPYSSPKDPVNMVGYRAK
ncbi:CoA-disulfide reductase [Paenisporosarcina quisquiliarum]|uniref:CoA-disulfide reductase n=1 Tax=Paenisporosarcina quisquiliarum TaxID=365346 RepID=A0A9X3LEL8_9BACL|nr:CoA-disulfide reductase [Paenisporosarcina quisquiliarum]MCZ8536587.1 CoA-disulfide reductase [Paenisporosarcina quisquiliarum]